MPTFDPSNASLHVFTFKEGLLSRAGHDLKLAAERFHVEVREDGRVVVEVDPASLRVLAAQKGGRDDLAALSRRDQRQIGENLRDDVLETSRYPLIRFTSHVDERRGDRLPGTLLLHGVERPVELELVEEPDHLVASVTLHQPDFGITPYTALLGAIRVKPDVRVVVELPSAEGLTAHTRS